MPNLIPLKRKKRTKKKETNRKFGYPCPVCASYNTKVLKKLSPTEETVVYGANMLPNYIRRRVCEECKVNWMTCESIVVNSVVDLTGKILL